LLAGAPDMTHRYVANKADLMPQFAQPQTKVRFLAIQKETRVEAAERLIEFAPDDHARTQDPGDLTRQFGEIASHVPLTRIAQGRPDFVRSAHREDAVARHAPTRMRLHRAVKASHRVGFDQLRLGLKQKDAPGPAARAALATRL